jgi:hypothetical protein
VKMPMVNEPEDWYEQWDDAPTTLGLTIVIEYRPHLGGMPERWTPEMRREFCATLTGTVAEYDKTARVVYQGNNTEDDPLPTSVIVWLEGWYADPTPEDRFRRSYAPPDPFAMRRHLERQGYHVSNIDYGYDPVFG